jgi:hypothetical protein
VIPSVSPSGRVTSVLASARHRTGVPAKTVAARRSDVTFGGVDTERRIEADPLHESTQVARGILSVGRPSASWT